MDLGRIVLVQLIELMLVLINYCLFLLDEFVSFLHLHFLGICEFVVGFSDVLACLFQLFPQSCNLLILIGILTFIFLHPPIDSLQFSLILSQKLLILINFSFLTDQLQFYFLLKFHIAAYLSVHFLDSFPQLLVFGL